MAFSAHTDPEAIKEHFDSPEVLEKKADQVANLIRQSRFFTVFTGAGISTSAGIPDFRGPTGVWTMRAKGLPTTSGTSSIKAIPTPSHMACVALFEKGILKGLVSQNTDGLHRRSGVPIEKFAELHGNTNLEKCEKCNREYLRDYRTRTAAGVHDHYTGSYCAMPNCGGKLKDTIINFSESLPVDQLERAWQFSNDSDLCLVLGSSLTVTPAAKVPERVARHGGRLVICNLQKTPLDGFATVRVFAKCDDLMELVMKKLDIAIPSFKLQRWVHLKLVNSTTPSSKDWKLSINGIDRDGVLASILNRIAIVRSEEGSNFLRTIPQATPIVLKKEPYELSASKAQEAGIKVDDSIDITLQFFGNYLEPDLTLKAISLNDLASRTQMVFKLEYDPYTRSWSTQVDDRVLSKTKA